MPERLLEPKPLSRPLKAVDTLLQPVMYTLGGFKSDSIQETHPWHIQEIDPELVNPELSVVIKGSAEERMNSHKLFLFHAPILGGWRHYTLLEAEEEFHIGWVARVRGKLAQAAVHRLRIDNSQVRMLNGPEGSETEYFAVSPNGTQSNLDMAGAGILGDHQFPDIRLL